MGARTDDVAKQMESKSSESWFSIPWWWSRVEYWPNWKPRIRLNTRLWGLKMTGVFFNHGRGFHGNSKCQGKIPYLWILIPCHVCELIICGCHLLINLDYPLQTTFAHSATPAGCQCHGIFLTRWHSSPKWRPPWNWQQRKSDAFNKWCVALRSRPLAASIVAIDSVWMRSCNHKSSERLPLLDR